MKKFLFVLLAAFIVISCQKKEVDTNPVTQEVSFQALEITPNSGLKSTTEWECKDIDPTNAHIVINNVPYNPALFELDGVLYTQALKLPVQDAEYCITEFFLFVDDGDGIYETGEEIVFGTPKDDSDYEVYINEDYRFDYCFTVEAFKKAEIPIEVLCYQDAEYDSFGFDWFQITEIVVRELCFFGDICLTNPPSLDDWVNNSLYVDQTNGIQFDMPAIFFIDIIDEDGNSVPYSPWSNEGSWGNVGFNGEGAPLCVAYPDNLMVDGEVFTVELYLYGPADGGGFGYSLYATWVIVDDVIYDTDDPDNIDDNTPVLPIGAEGIYDFVVGDCVNNPPDIYFPPYDPEYPPINENCETAFAYNQDGVDGQTRYCFLQLDKDDASYNENGASNENFNRWGWTNQLLAEGEYTFEIYAAAGQCDLDKGTLVGHLTVNYQHGDVDVTYNMETGFKLSQVHVYVGSDIVYKKKQGQNYVYTVAPGQYPWVDDNLSMLSTYTTPDGTFTGMTGNVYVVAHAVVCGTYD